MCGLAWREAAPRQKAAKRLYFGRGARDGVFPKADVDQAKLRRHQYAMGGRRLDRSNFGKSLFRVFVIPIDGGFPSGRCLRGDVIRPGFQIGSIMGQDEVKVVHVDIRLIPVDQRRNFITRCAAMAAMVPCLTL